jgi:PAS domain S-box-containing protein
MTKHRGDPTSLAPSEERFRLLVESVQDYAIFLLERDGTIASWNAGAERLKGYTTEEILGRNFSVFYPEEDVENGKPGRELEEATRDGRIEDEGWRVRKDGTRFWANVIITALHDSDGTLRGFAKVERDLTERWESEDRTRKALERERRTSERLRELDRLKNDFVAIVAHDLRSPMSVVQGFADAMLANWDGYTDVQKKEFLETISRNVRGLGRLVEDVLQVARIESGDVRYEISAFDIAAVARRVAEELTAPGRTEDRITVSAPKHLPRVRGDERRTWEVITNLVTNALKFSLDEAPVEVEIAEEDDMLRLSVTDHGRGIAPADFPKLFKKFSRIEDPGVKREKGTGLGLFICKELVEAQGGHITVESEVGRGSTFTFTMPIDKSSENFAVLLVVEDDPDMRNLIRVTLGADPRLSIVGEASTAREAIEVTKTALPRVIILDHFIEGDIMGLDAAPMLKTVAPSAKIILFTSYDLALEAQREPAVDVFLQKSHMPQLLPTVQRLLGL